MDVTSDTDDQFPAGLTQKQCEVLDLVLLHKTNKEIARVLDVSPSAVEQRLAAAKGKLMAESRFDAARLYAELKNTCGESTGGFEQVGQVLSDRHFSDREANDPVMEFGDAMPFDSGAWPETSSAFRFLEATKAPPGVWSRLGLIVIFALVIIATATIALSTTEGIADLLTA